jgi:REP element-mobilizing transposase RayT
LGEVFRKLAEPKECRLEEGHLLAGHVHMMISIPPQYGYFCPTPRNSLIGSLWSVLLCFCH